MPTLPPDYAERVYAGWLGKCIGVRFGAPTESMSAAQIQALFGELDHYLQTDPRVFHPDDDLTMPLLMLNALEQFGPDPSSAQFGETWLNTIADGRGTLWWGGYGISTEHTAYENLRGGIAAPASGSIAINGPVIAQQIGGQIFSDGWGLICPNNPARAAELARRAAQVSHDGWAVHGAMFIAAMNAVAFGAASAREVVERALSVLPAGSHYAEVAREVIAFHDAQPASWRACYDWIHAHRGYARYPGRVHVIPNAALCVMALLYGNDDYSRTIQIANMGGWDTDCNAGNVGSVMGVLRGLAGIPARWRHDLNDFFTLASLHGSRNLMDVAGAAERFIRHGHIQAGEPYTPPAARYTWRFAGSTQGWEPIQEGPAITALTQGMVDGGPALRIGATEVGPHHVIGAYTRTYLRPEQLDGNFYQGSFSPTLVPGQTISCELMAAADTRASWLAQLFITDANSGETLFQSPGRVLRPGEWAALSWRVPPMHGVCITQTGVRLTSQIPGTRHEVVYLRNFDWSGAPAFAFDFAKERIETDACSQWTFVRGFWSLEGDAYVGSGVRHNETYSGDLDWTNYALSAEVTPLAGDRHMLLARARGASHSYALALLPGRLALMKNERGYRELAAAPLAWTHEQPLRLTLAVEGYTLRGRCGDVQLAWNDTDVIASGMIGLANGPGCRTAFRNVALA